MVLIDILQLVDYLDRMAGKAMRLPGGKVVLDQTELSAVIEQLRLALPTEIKEARQVLEQRSQLLSQARDASSDILRQAQFKAAQHLDEHQLIQQAQEQASEIVSNAHEDADNIVNGADDYAEESLRQLAASIAQLNAVIQNGIHALASRRSKRVQKSSSAAPVFDTQTAAPVRDAVKNATNSRTA